MMNSLIMEIFADPSTGSVQLLINKITNLHLESSMALFRHKKTP